MGRSPRLAQSLLLVLVLLGASGCGKLLAALGKGDDAGVDASAAVASADPSASATAAVTASAPSATTAATVAAKVAPKCAKGESLVELADTGTRGCATDCTDPSCDCQIAFTVLPNGKVSSAPGDRRSFCMKAKAGAKKAVPKCPKGQSLFAEDDSSPLFCSRSCEKDADCRPSKCNQNLFNGDETGAIFAGVGKQVFACDRGFGAAPAASGSAGPSASSVVLAIPPGGPGVIQNPNGQPCPVGYSNAGGVLKTCNKKCENGAKCPAGSKCSDVLLVCR